MGTLGWNAALILLVVLAQPLTASGQAPRCAPGMSNDACDQWQFEQADKQLGEVVNNKLSELARRSAIERSNEVARASLVEAQRVWQLFRDAECKAKVAANMVSARTRQGLTSACLLSLTQQRITDVGRF